MVLAQFTQAQLDEIYAFAIDLGRQAGDLLLESMEKQIASNSQNAYTEKDNAVDIVTQTDGDVETFIRMAIRGRYPQHKFLGEETYAKDHGQSQTQSREYLIDAHPTWVIDPLDGTINFTHLFPLFCVSISLVVSHRPVIGVIYAPATHQLFSSCIGRGAWLNGRRLPLRADPIPPMPAAAPRGCLFACEWGKERRDGPGGNLRRKVESFVGMAAETKGKGMVHGVRSLGSAALDLAYTAMGAVDIWWEGGCWEWDVAAGIAILVEAGGLVTTANPPANPETDPIEEACLGSRLYLAIRPAGPSDTETGRQTQERTVREVWKRVRALDYKRPCS